MFLAICGSAAFDLCEYDSERAINAKPGETRQTKRPADPPALRLVFATAHCGNQHVALPQRAVLIFSFSPSSPTAPTTICLPIT